MTTPSWVPTADGTVATLFADFTTEALVPAVIYDTQGRFLAVDSLSDRAIGTPITVGQATNLIMAFGTLPADVQLVFMRPDGTQFTIASSSGQFFIGTTNLDSLRGNFSASQYVVFNTYQGQLNQIGTWTVQPYSSGLLGPTVEFTVYRS